MSFWSDPFDIRLSSRLLAARWFGTGSTVNPNAPLVERPLHERPPEELKTSTVNLAQANTPDHHQPTKDEKTEPKVPPSKYMDELNKNIDTFIRDKVIRREMDYEASIIRARAWTAQNADTMKRDGNYPPHDTFDLIISTRRELLDERIKQTVDAFQYANKNGDPVPVDREFVTREADRIYRDLDKEVANRVRAQHHSNNPNISKDILDKEVDLTFDAVSKYSPSKGGILKKITSAFHDEDKGGVQVGGIGGALLGFVMASTFVTDAGWLGNLLKLAFVGIGAYAGNAIVDNIKSKNTYESLKGNSNTAAKQPEQTQGKVIEQGVEDVAKAQTEQKNVSTVQLDRKYTPLQSQEAESITPPPIAMASLGKSEHTQNSASSKR